MATTEERVKQLVADNLEVDGQPLNTQDMTVPIADYGIDSAVMVAFVKEVEREFGVSFFSETGVRGAIRAEGINTLADLVTAIDALPPAENA